MLLRQGEKVHVVERRVLESDARRHFVGEVESSNDTAMRVTGHLFVFDGATSRFVRKPERRTRIIPIDPRMIINVIPANVAIEALRYEQRDDQGLVVTDGAGFVLDINEFSPTQ